MDLIRKQVFIDNDGQSIFFWGARQTGKSHLLKILFPEALVFDLLLSDVYKRLITNPEYIRETILAQEKKLVIIDEIQRIPILLNEVHWLIENHAIQFVLSGSSPRKIIRSGENLLGGRALKYSLYPGLVSQRAFKYVITGSAVSSRYKLSITNLFSVD